MMAMDPISLQVLEQQVCIPLFSRVTVCWQQGYARMTALPTCIPEVAVEECLKVQLRPELDEQVCAKQRDRCKNWGEGTL